jgi:hypothetical protein
VNECNHAVAGSCAKCEPCGVCGRPKGDPHRYPVAGECTAPDSSDYTVSLQCLSIALRKAQDDVKAAEERGRLQGQFSPLGDNHHNAANYLAPRDSARCPDGDPYCSCQKPMDAPRDSGPACNCPLRIGDHHLATCATRKPRDSGKEDQ